MNEAFAEGHRDPAGLRTVCLVPNMGTRYAGVLVKVISRGVLRKFWERDDGKAAKQPFLSWFKEAEKAEWKNPAEVKRFYGSADIVGDDRIVFNIGGNKFRLVVWVKYSIQLVLIKWVGTHDEYDEIDVTKVGLPPAAKRPAKRPSKSEA